MKDKLVKLQFTEVKAVKTADGEWRLEALGAPFGGHNGGKDYDGEFFSPRTDFMMDIGDSRPVIYFHGLTAWGGEQKAPSVIGKATLTRIDSAGLWFDIILDKTKTLAKRIWDNAIKGIVKASSGAVNYLVRKNITTGEILSWALGELTLVDEGQGRMAANQLATVSLKTLFDEADIELPQDFVQVDNTTKTELEQEKEAEIIEEEVIADPVVKEEDKESKLTKDELLTLGATFMYLVNSLEETTNG